tara:strand:- start:17 stop:361 length:345 start_codon:yes stop_codon:yes gene_type:complete
MSKSNCFGDVPLNNAVILWNGKIEAERGKDFAVAVVPEHQERTWGKWDFAMDTGAVICGWEKLSPEQRLIHLYKTAVGMILTDEIPAETVFEAFSVIPEFRESVKRQWHSEVKP